MEMNTFKTTKFGGFDKQDVLDGFEALSREYKAETDELQRQIASLKTKKFEIATQLEKMKAAEKQKDELIGKLRITEKYSSIPITALTPVPTGIVAIELKRSIARKLIGKEIKVICADGIYTYKVLQDKPSDWHEFNVDTRQEVIK